MPRRMRRKRKRRTSNRAFGAAVRSIIKSQSETKFVDRAVSGFNLTSTSGAINGIFSIPLGTGQAERIGNQVRLVAVHCDAVISMVSPAALHALHISVFKRKGSFVGAAPTVANLVEYLDPDLYVVKKDKYYTLVPTAVILPQVRFSYHKRWPASSGGQVVNYNGVGGFDIESGNWQIWFGNSNTTAGDLLLDFRCRVFYKDM